MRVHIGRHFGPITSFLGWTLLHMRSRREVSHQRKYKVMSMKFSMDFLFRQQGRCIFDAAWCDMERR